MRCRTSLSRTFATGLSRDWSVRGAQVHRLTHLQQRNHYCFLPHIWDNGAIEGEVVEAGEVEQAPGPKMLQVMNREFIRAQSHRVTAVSYSFLNYFWGENIEAIV